MEQNEKNPTRPRPEGDGWVWNEEKGKWVRYRIRKLTPRECFRLMGVRDNYIDQLQSSGVSESQPYKLAGNSIVVDVLDAIYENLFFAEEKPMDTLF